MFIKTTIFIMDQGGTIERRVGELPAIVRPPRIKVSTPADADSRETAKLLRHMADQIEEAARRAGRSDGIGASCPRAR